MGSKVKKVEHESPSQSHQNRIRKWGKKKSREMRKAKWLQILIAQSLKTKCKSVSNSGIISSAGTSSQDDATEGIESSSSQNNNKSSQSRQTHNLRPRTAAMVSKVTANKVKIIRNNVRKKSANVRSVVGRSSTIKNKKGKSPKK
ncbi:hypothetical protein CDAR_412231 [Caerostris darwini]|uniref:Uncharacterized protein n=1 Tax=Caerostris darwini TaxID=1538125 RepID=A0AAV4VAH2_9ARAC|nr:hypothetical protein CDAR_412231 [Caerostris darwini]